MSLILLVLGIASFIGNLIGGHVSDRIGYSKSMLVGAGSAGQYWNGTGHAE